MDRERPERLIKVDNETHSTTSRLTAEGKRLTYKLEVIQQPQRARACGAGAKSSADRRPVDPPPIVELKVFDGDVAPENDITFTMNANYFLFATLEQARPIAQGRVPEDKNRLTVLTGTAVAGMVYLDRPSAAGYFIFSDLSVRHEGKYRLSFSLYEELKNPKDYDKIPDTCPSDAGESHVTHRLEVKSIPFTVFSAKKFPGLAESTSLSRMVAEQGCRVRIRRDVRMRRRDQKSGKDWDDYEEDTAQARAKMSSTPESMHYSSMPGSHVHAEHASRPRSSSHGSLQSLPAALSRRQSTQDMGQPYPQPYGAAPLTQQIGYGQSTHGPASRQHYPPPSFANDSQVMQPPTQQQPTMYTQSSASANASQQAGFYGYLPAQVAVAPTQQPQMSQYAPHPAYETNLTPAQRPSIQHNHQYQQNDDHSSLQYAQPHQQPTTSYQSTPQQVYQPSPPTLSSRSSFPSLTPSFGSHEYDRAQPIQPSTRAIEPNTLVAGRSHTENVLPPLRIPDTPTASLEASSPASALPQSTYFPSAMDPHQKRSYGSVFNDRHLQQRLLDGTRPAASYNQDASLSGNQYAAADADDNASDFDPAMLLRKRMDYRRADGSSAQRCLPQSL